MKSPYETHIEEELNVRGRPDVNPRFVESCMRMAHPTLDGLSKYEFALEIEIGIEMHDQTTYQERVEIMYSFGFAPHSIETYNTKRHPTA